MDITALAPAAATTAVKATDNGPKIASDFETFLKMLTVQMQNQDPLNPTKAEDFAVQLATFSNVEQQVYTNQLLESLIGQMNVSGAAQFAGWIGMEARAPIAVAFDGSTPVTVAPHPEAGADEAYLAVHNAAGLEVDRYPIPVSNALVEWDGTSASGLTLPAGVYGFAVESWSDGQLQAVTKADAYGRVVEARLTNGETVLVLEGGVEVAADQVTALREPAA